MVAFQYREHHKIFQEVCLCSEPVLWMHKIMHHTFHVKCIESDYASIKESKRNVK